MSKSMFNEDFYKLRRDFNPRVVPSVDFIPDPDDPGYPGIQRNMPYPDPFGGELPLDSVKANPIPSQMPGAMGGGFGHGIAGNLSDIQQMPYRYGDQTGGIQQMPYIDGQGQGGIQQMPYIPGTSMGNMGCIQIAQGQGGFNIMNPFTYGNMKKAVEGTRAGDENIEYSDTPVGKIGEAANERNRMIQQLLQGY